MNENFGIVLGKKFPQEEVRQVAIIIDERKFSFIGTLPTYVVFLYAIKHGKNLQEIIEACKAECDKTWKFHKNGTGGTSDTVCRADSQNIIDIYKALGLSSPFGRLVEGVPEEAIVVTTSHSIYRFGKAQQNGHRTVSRDGKPLEKIRNCWILTATIGEELVFVSTNPETEGMSIASEVGFIVPDYTQGV